MTPLPILLAAVFLGTGNCSSKIVHGSSFLQSILKPLGRFKKKLEIIDIKNRFRRPKSQDY